MNDYNSFIKWVNNWLEMARNGYNYDQCQGSFCTWITEHKKIEIFITFLVTVISYLSTDLNFSSHSRHFPGMYLEHFNPFPKKNKLQTFCKLKKLANDNVKFNENGGQFSKRAENTLEKGEIARYEQFLLFPLCFQKIFTADIFKRRACLGKG